MTQYIKAEGLVFPYTDSDMRKDNPNVSFPENISDDNRASVGVFPIVIEDKPVYNKDTQVISRGDPVFTEGSGWSVGWSVRDKTTGEVSSGLTRKREAMKCSRLQGRLVLGETTCAALDALADNTETPWAMRETITNAIEWSRLSQSMTELGYLLGYTDTQMDALFTVAMTVDV